MDSYLCSLCFSREWPILPSKRFQRFQPAGWHQYGRTLRNTLRHHTRRVRTFFVEQIVNMARQYGVTLKEMYQRLKLQYDGYHFCEKMTDVYNPFSLLNAFGKHRFVTTGSARVHRLTWFVCWHISRRTWTNWRENTTVRSGSLTTMRMWSSCFWWFTGAVPHYQGLWHATEPFPAGFSEQWGEGWFPDGPCHFPGGGWGEVSDEGCLYNRICASLIDRSTWGGRTVGTSRQHLENRLSGRRVLDKGSTCQVVLRCSAFYCFRPVLELDSTWDKDGFMGTAFTPSHTL